MIVFLCLLGLVSLSFGQLVSKGKCLNPEPVEFDECKFVGKWRQEWRINNTFEPDFQCSEITLSKNKDGYFIGRVEGILPTAGARIVWNGILIPDESSDPAVSHLKWESYATDPGVNVVIADADWDSWFVVYGCTQNGHLKSEYVWVYLKDIDTCDVAAISQSVEKLGVCLDDLSRISRKNCPRDQTPQF